MTMTNNTNSIKTIIIDDEMRSIATLKNLIRDYCDGLEIIATADSVETGVKVLEENAPDLLFLDIAMPDGNGFELLEQIDKKTFEVIFTTAFEQYAIRAFDFSAMHYLLKPINPEQLQQVVDLYQKKSKSSFHTDRYEILEQALDNTFKRIALPCMDGIEFVQLDDIMYCQADSNYCIFHLVNGKSVMVSRALSFYEKLLQGAFFYRDI